MGGSSNDNSFIPKRGPVSRPRQTGARQVYVFTLVSYVLFFTSLIAAGGLFLYERYIDEQLQNEIIALDVEIERFREADLENVRSFNSRLEYSKERLDATVSLPALFSVLEATTAETAQIERLTIQRIGDERLAVSAAFLTDTFDSALFQREFYEQEQLIDQIALSDVTIELGSEETGESALTTRISFDALLAVPTAAIPLTVTPASLSAPIVEPASAVDETTTTTEALLPATEAEPVVVSTNEEGI